MSLFFALVGCDNTVSPACPDAIVRSVSEAQAPEAYAAARSAQAGSTLFDTVDPAQADVPITVEVVAVDEVEWVERVACSGDVGHRANVQVEIYAADGSLSVRGPGLVSLPTDGSVVLAVETADLLIDETTVVTDFDRPDNVVLGGVALAADSESNTVTLVRIDMADDCTSVDECDAVERIALASWQQPPLSFDLWFDRLGP